MNRIENLKIRPYARLLTMLGDQLIKDEIIALIELVKNSYDADAEHVMIEFNNFTDEFMAMPTSSIVIEDDGNGMNEELLKKGWMNPATPEKLHKKRECASTDKGRIIQGEKGIGRFAIFKLGRSIRITTRRQKEEYGHFVNNMAYNEEYLLNFDFSRYDKDFLQHDDKESEIYLDDLNVGLEVREARTIVKKEWIFGEAIVDRKPYGTKIEIYKLNGTKEADGIGSSWNKEKLKKVYQYLRRLQPIFGEKFTKDFSVNMMVNGKPFYPEDDEPSFSDILAEKSVLIVEGQFDSEKRIYDFTLNNANAELEFHMSLNDSRLRGIKPMHDYLVSLDGRDIESGSFKFKYYILDLDISSRDKDTRYYLDPTQKKYIKEHRVYLYRDGIRVMPYGDADDDWLMLDVTRGTESAGSILGNDQIVGYILITQEGNPKLTDKTNREGLIDEGHAFEDLIRLNQLLLRYLRAVPYKQYLIDKKNRRYEEKSIEKKPLETVVNARKLELGKKIVERFLKKYGDRYVDELTSIKNNNTGEGTDETYEEKKEKLIKRTKNLYDGNDVLDSVYSELEQSINNSNEAYNNRISTVENLAAVGLSVQTAYHDARILLVQMKDSLNLLIKKYSGYDAVFLDRMSVINELEPLKKQFDTVVRLMNNLQRLFPSTRTRKTEISISKVIVSVKDLYHKAFEKENIKCDIEVSSTKPFKVECTDAVLLQVFINLFDNSLYWLKTVGTDRHIRVFIDNGNRSVYFSDSGPGIRKDIEPYIFEPFFSSKGEDGKGLGLYIARQLLGRYNGTIELVNGSNKMMSGANFVVSFSKQEVNHD